MAIGDDPACARAKIAAEKKTHTALPAERRRREMRSPRKINSSTIPVITHTLNICVIKEPSDIIGPFEELICSTNEDGHGIIEIIVLTTTFAETPRTTHKGIVLNVTEAILASLKKFRFLAAKNSISSTTNNALDRSDSMFMFSNQAAEKF